MEKNIEIDGNKLIGVFHGAEYSSNTQRLYYESESMIDFALSIHATIVNIKEAKYHTSWDWLMPVVHKIGGLAYPPIGDKESKPKELGIAYMSIMSTKEDVWRAVVQFITWYNTHQSQTPNPKDGEGIK